MVRRNLSAYEINLLIKHGKYPEIERYPADMPVEYIVGKAEFMGREFEVDKRVLIPRIETEEMVEGVVRWITQRRNEWSGQVMIADVGTGSGCVGISVYLELKALGIPARVTLSDLKSAALEVCRANVNKLIDKKDVQDISMIQSDLLLDYSPNLYPSVITANLPYIPRTTIKDLDSSVRKFEPVSALDGGADGLVLVRSLIDQATKLPTPAEVLFLEVDEFVTKAHLTPPPGYTVDVVTDQFEKNRFLVVERLT